MHVVELRVAVVNADQDLVLDRLRRPDDLHAGVFERRHQLLFAARNVDHIEQEVLVAALILDVADALAVG